MNKLLVASIIVSIIYIYYKNRYIVNKNKNKKKIYIRGIVLGISTYILANIVLSSSNDEQNIINEYNMNDTPDVDRMLDILDL